MLFCSRTFELIKKRSLRCCFVSEHLDFMNTVDTSEMVFEQFKQLEHDYIGYQSLTDVPRSLTYTEDFVDHSVSTVYPLNIYRH